MAYWAKVKVEYSPPTFTTEDKSPFYISGRNIPVKIPSEEKRKLPNNTYKLTGLSQGVIYTFHISLTKGPLESRSFTFTQSIPKLLESGALKEPDQLTCKVPTYLAPRNLAFYKKLTGEVSLTITWDHPLEKAPELGYKIVVAPFDDNRYTQPQLHRKDFGEDNLLVLEGMNYDPFMEYSISVIAVHDPESKQHYRKLKITVFPILPCTVLFLLFFIFSLLKPEWTRFHDPRLHRIIF